jgi:hypothetical protein
VQNSIKYNKIYDGDVIITLKFKPQTSRDERKMQPQTDQDSYTLETKVIDSGVGMS